MMRSTPVPRYHRGMPDTPRPGGSRAAVAWLIKDPARTDAEAGRLHGITREAVRQARTRLLSAPRKTGRPKSKSPRTFTIYVSVAGKTTNVRVSADEREAFEGAAGDAPIGAWLARLLTERPRPRGDRTPISRYLRELGRRAAEMPEQ